MALTGTTTTVMKEFLYQTTGTRARLVMGWDGDHPAYHAVEIKTGLNFPSLHPEYGVSQTQIFGPSLSQYAIAAHQFAEIVRPML